MGFRGQPWAYDSPAAAVAGMVERLCSTWNTSAGEACALGDALGRVTAEAIVADRDSPPSDCSAMDGYAVRSADLARARGDGAVRLAVTGEVRIGHAPQPMPGDTGAVRIVTGGAIPMGADLVVRREDVTEERATTGDATVAAITIARESIDRIRALRFIRRRGENGGTGDVVVPKGTVLSAAAIGAAAAVGCASPRVYPRVRVAIISTGDELVSPQETPGPFQIRDGNAASVGAIFASRAWAQVIGVHHVRDDRASLAGVLARASADADAVIISGGVSMGHRDPVRAVVEATGAEIVFHGLPQRPGKPMLSAVAMRAQSDPVIIFGLPGNPVSAMVTTVRIVTPVLEARAGIAGHSCVPRVGIANLDDQSIDLWWHRLVRIDGDGRAELIDTRSSGDAPAAGRADGFIELPPRTSLRAAGLGAGYPFYAWPR